MPQRLKNSAVDGPKEAQAERRDEYPHPYAIFGRLMSAI